MNFLINASNLRFGGGLTVAIQLMKATLPLRMDDHFYLLSPTNVGYEVLNDYPNLTIISVKNDFHSSVLSKIKHNWFVFPKHCRKLDIQKVVSLGNVAFSCDGIPHLLYIQLPHIVYPESPAWKKMDWKSFMYNSFMDQYVAYFMRYGSSFAVQTNVMRARLCKRFDLDQNLVHILPNAPVDSTIYEVTPFPAPVSGTVWKLLVLSKYYPHKNFEVLLQLANIIRAQDLPFKIVLTLEAHESMGAASILQAIQDQQLSEIMYSIGNVKTENISQLMQSNDALLLPTMLESFSGAYSEALRYGLPIFTSHYDFATALLGDAAFYFDPLKPEHIAKVLQDAYQKPDLVQEKQKKGAALFAKMPSWPQIAHQFSHLLDTFV